MAQNYNLGTATGTIQINYAGQGVTQAQQGLAGVGQTAQDQEAKLNSLGTKMVGFGAIVAGGFALAVKSASDFEFSLSGIQAVSGATQTEMEAIRNKALQLGKDTIFSASDAADAIQELVKAGVSVPDVMNGAADATVALAAAGGVSLPEAATIASNAMNQFGLSAAELPKVADLIAGAANASAIDVHQFGYSLSQVGAVAKLAGLDFADTAVAIAEMGQAGIVGSDAGTSLKTFLNNLNPSTKEATTLMKDLGIITADGANKFYDAAGSLRPLAEVQQVLQDSLKGMTDQQKQATLQTLFGSDAIRAAAVLANNGAQGFDTMAAAMGKVTAAGVAATRMDNLQGSIEQLKGSVETAGIQIGTVLIPYVRGLVDWITQLVNWFSNLSPGWQQVIMLAIASTGAIVGLAGAFIKVVQFVKALNGAFVLLGANPLVLIIAAIVAALILLGVAFYELYQHSETFRNIVQAVLSAVQTATAAVVSWFESNWPRIQAVIMAVVAWLGSNVLPIIVAVFNAIVTAAIAVVDAIIGSWPTIQRIAEAVWGGIQTAVSVAAAVISAVINAIVVAFNAVSTAAQAVWSVISAAFAPMTALFAGIISIIMPLAELIGAVLYREFQVLSFLITNVFIPAFQMILAIVIPIVMTLVSTIITQFQIIYNVVSAIIGFLMPFIIAQFQIMFAVVSAVMSVLVPVITTAFQLILDVVTYVLDILTTIIQTAFDVIRDIINIATDLIMGRWGQVWNDIKQLFSDIWEGIKAYFSATLGFIVSFFSDWLNGVQAIWSGAWNGIVNLLQTAWSSMVNAISSALGSIWGLISSIPGTILAILGGLGSLLIGLGGALISGFVDGINGMIGFAMSVISGIPGQALNAIGNVGSLLYNAGSKLISGFVDGIKSMIGSVKDTLGNITSSLTSWKGPPQVDARILTDNGELVMQGFINGVVNKIPLIRRTLQGITNGLPDYVASANINLGGSAGAAAQPQMTPASSKQTTVQFITNNPAPEKASDSNARRLRSAAALGVFGG